MKWNRPKLVAVGDRFAPIDASPELLFIDASRYCTDLSDVFPGTVPVTCIIQYRVQYLEYRYCTSVTWQVKI